VGERPMFVEVWHLELVDVGFVIVPKVPWV
jgi:hypothetical protein